MANLRIVSDRGDSFEHPLETSSVTIGRSSQADLQLPDRFLSRAHARLYTEEDVWWVEDLESRNGTLLNGSRLKGPTRLSPGDELRICRNTIIFDDDTSPATAETTHSGQSESLFVEADELDMWSRRGVDLSRAAEAELGHQAEMLHMLNEVHRALGSSMRLDELLELLLDRAFEVLSPDEALIFLRQADGSYYRAAERTMAEVDAEHLYSETLLHEVAEKGMAALVTDVPHDPVFGPADSVLAHGIRSLAAAPLSTSEGSFGMLVITSIGHEVLFHEEDVELLVSLASIAAMRIRNIELAARAAEEAATRARLEEEISLARQIQMRLLPSALPAISSYEIYGANVPSRGVSGDFYTVIERADGQEFVLLVADVSGKGMAASLLTFSLEALAAGPIEIGDSPSEICAKVSRRLMARTLPTKYVTLFLGVLDQSSHCVTYCNAGQNPPLLVSGSGKIRWLEATGPPVALLAEARFGEARLDLQPADLLVIYTDGVTEAANAKDEEFGQKRLREVFKRHRGAALSQIGSELRAALDAFVGDVPYSDDQTLLMLRRV